MGFQGLLLLGSSLFTYVVHAFLACVCPCRPSAELLMVGQALKMPMLSRYVQVGKALSLEPKVEVPT